MRYFLTRTLNVVVLEDIHAIHVFLGLKAMTFAGHVCWITGGRLRVLVSLACLSTMPNLYYHILYLPYYNII